MNLKQIKLQLQLNQVDPELIEDSLHLAEEFEGVKDLLIEWYEEPSLQEKEEILCALYESVMDILNAYS